MEPKEMFLARLEREEAITRKAIERVPEGSNDWMTNEESIELAIGLRCVAA
jgi:hypothetical protein